MAGHAGSLRDLAHAVDAFAAVQLQNVGRNIARQSSIDQCIIGIDQQRNDAGAAARVLGKAVRAVRNRDIARAWRKKHQGRSCRRRRRWRCRHRTSHFSPQILTFVAMDMSVLRHLFRHQVTEPVQVRPLQLVCAKGLVRTASLNWPEHDHLAERSTNHGAAFAASNRRSVQLLAPQRAAFVRRHAHRVRASAARLRPSSALRPGFAGAPSCAICPATASWRCRRERRRRISIANMNA